MIFDVLLAVYHGSFIVVLLLVVYRWQTQSYPAMTTSHVYIQLINNYNPISCFIITITTKIIANRITSAMACTASN